MNSELVWSALVADGLALGPHWVYDQNEISKNISDFYQVNNPLCQYHPGKVAGDFTHYGDQMECLIQSIAETKSFDPQHYSEIWQSFWKNPKTKSYVDGATKETLARLDQGIPVLVAGSPSHDLAGASRIAPLFLLSETSAIESAAPLLTSLTHNNPSVMEASIFFTRVSIKTIQGLPANNAIDEVWKNGQWDHLSSKWMESANDSSKSKLSDAEIANKMGQGCDIESAFPLTCHFLLKYPINPRIALERNYQVGGDSSARGIIIGTVLSTEFNKADVSLTSLKSELNAYSRLSNYLD